MENLDVQSKVNSPKKNVWGIIISVVLALVIITVVLIYVFLLQTSSKNSVARVGMCSGTNIVFFAGGAENDSFATVVANGAKAAQADLGANVKYVYSDWDTNQMVSQFIDAMSQSPDAIAIMGHPGSKALDSLIDEAERKNIIVTSLNVDLSDIREKYSSRGFGYVGQSVYASGLTVSNAVIRKYNLKEGTEAVVFGVDKVSNPSRYERTKGVIDGLSNGKLVVHEIAMPLDVQKDANSEAAKKMVADALTAYPNTKVIITDHGQLTASISDHLKSLNKNPGDFIVAGFDLSAGTVAGIKTGYVGLILDQQPYLQGYLPILQACLTKKYSFAGLYVDTGVGLIDESNVDLVAGLAEQKIR